VRRLHAAGVLPGRALSALYRERSELKRKHFLRTLAVEAGFADWESCKPQLERLPAGAFVRFKVEEDWFAYLNSWFSSESQAQEFVSRHGGTVVRVGTQAVVLSSEANLTPIQGEHHAARVGV
jgi:nitrous oxide reductase accessory protein NosL